jgi:ribonuclease HII
MPDSSFERAAKNQGYTVIAGIDEVGRGPWAGPVYAAAVVLDTRRIAKCGLADLDDSKKLTAETRERLSLSIREHCHFGIGFCDVAEIDRLNIFHASMLAMTRALAALPVVPDYCLVDGNKLPKLACAGLAIVEGDARSYSIAAASIVAKVTRDAVMSELAHHCPGYGWERNKGYGTREHRDGIERHGVSEHHRRSWTPIFNKLNQLTLDLQDVESGESDNSLIPNNS